MEQFEGNLTVSVDVRYMEVDEQMAFFEKLENTYEVDMNNRELWYMYVTKPDAVRFIKALNTLNVPVAKVKVEVLEKDPLTGKNKTADTLKNQDYGRLLERVKEAPE